MKNNKKIFLIMAAIIILIVVILVIYVLLNTDSTNEMVCESTNVNITLYYTKESIVGYTSNGYSYDLFSESNLANEIGIDKYLEDFSNVFNINNNGTCVKN